MKLHILPRMLILLIVLLASCTPKVVIPVEPAAPSNVPATVTPAEPAANPTIPTDVPAASITTPIAVATSRGSELVASDPVAVNLASGGLQLVEFFRFT